MLYFPFVTLLLPFIYNFLIPSLAQLKMIQKTGSFLHVVCMPQIHNQHEHEDIWRESSHNLKGSQKLPLYTVSLFNNEEL